MALNIFPRRGAAAEPAPAPEPTKPLPEPSAEALADTRKRSRRGSRGGRGRGRAPGAGTPTPTEAVAEEAPATAAVEATVELVAGPVARRPRKRPAPEARVAAEVAPEATVLMPAVEAAAPRPRRAPKAPAPVQEAVTGDGSTAAILRAVEQQGRQIEQLIRMQEETAKRGGAHVAAPPARVGVFVDAANIELACERLRSRFDWAKVLRMLTHDRQLVRAIAYSPVHDDPNVSIETQRFVEPFLDKGYKVVTKPLKRFQDGTIKANVDIELALDVIAMLDRLDVVCLVSGDGDFQRLVELVQGKGVRVEVVAVASSTATNLRHAADEFIDLQSRLRDIRA